MSDLTQRYYPARYRVQHAATIAGPWTNKGNATNDVEEARQRCRRFRIRASQMVGDPTKYRVWDRIDGREVEVQ